MGVKSSMGANVQSLIKKLKEAASPIAPDVTNAPQLGALEDGYTDALNTLGIISFDKEYCLHSLSYLVTIRTVVRSEISAYIPMELLDNLTAGTPIDTMTAVMDYAVRVGKVTPLSTLEAYSGAPAYPPSNQPLIVLLGGPDVGDLVSNIGNVFKATTKGNMVVGIPPYSNKSHTTPRSIEYYTREEVALQTDSGVKRAFVYRHDSVPSGGVVGLFFDTLKEFPILRAVPHYNPFWKHLS